MRNALRCLFVITLVAAAGRMKAFADTISFTGNLRTDANFTSCGPGCTLGPGNTDGDYAQWAAVAVTFPVTSLSQMEAITFSYGGGTNAQGAAIPQSGFEPYLSLFDSAGDFLASTFSGVTCPPGAHTNTASGQCFDVELNGGTLAPGTYRIAISAFENISFAENLGSGTLSDGFTGLGNLAAGEDLHYAFDVILTPATATPEPSTGFLLSAALIVLYLNRFKKGFQS
jgi:hypothetical protein